MGEEPTGLEVKFNRLPQWRSANAVYFVTWCLQDRNHKLSPAERTLIANAIKHFRDQRYRLAIFIVMDDHVHLVIQTMPGFDLSDILHSWKSYTSSEINKLRGVKGQLWQKDSYTEILRNWEAIRTRMEYVYQNPFRRWGIEPHTYQWLEHFE